MFLGNNLFEDNFHDWKITLFLKGKHLGKNLKFHNNTNILSKHQYHSFKTSIFLWRYFHKIDK